MDKLRIQGGLRLQGSVQVGGAKNAALKMLAAGLLTRDELVLRNVPMLADITTMSRLLAAMGAKETSLIIELIKSLSKKSNISIIVIDHNYTHLFEICDRINVIQHGQVTVDKSLSEIKLEELIEFMVQSFRRDVATGGAK